MARPMVTGKDLTEAGYKPGLEMGKLIKRAKELHFSGIEKKRVLSQLKKENPPK